MLLAGALGHEGIGVGEKLLRDLRPPGRNDQRNIDLRALGEALAPGASVRKKCAAIRAEYRRYRPRWQRVDQHRSTAPKTYAGTYHQLLFSIFAGTGGAPPASDSQLERILKSLR